MLTLYSYPELFGVADNNGYGLKVFAFLRLNGVRVGRPPRSRMTNCGHTQDRTHALSPYLTWSLHRRHSLRPSRAARSRASGFVP
jgi:hypothetical protein